MAFVKPWGLEVHLRSFVWVIGIVCLWTGSASAQIGLPRDLSGMQALPGSVVRGLPLDDLPFETGRLQDRLGDGLDRVARAPDRLRSLIRQSDGVLEADPDGWPVVRAEILAVDPSPAARQAALDAGYRVVREERLPELDLVTVVLAPPPRLSLARAIGRLQQIDPQGSYAFNHVHTPSGEAAEAIITPPTRSSATAPVAASVLQTNDRRIGLIDTGVDATHPTLARGRIVRQAFAGADRPAPHGTAVASLLVGQAGAFSGAAPGTTLYAADVYGGRASGGDSTALARALAWMVQNRVPVVNVSLVGPRNALVEAAVQRAGSRGVLIVAAVGNDGPAAPPLFPAAYPGVVGVTAVGGRDRVLPEAGRGPQVDFSAPGADMAAAGQDGGYVSVRGTSFAAPLVAGLLSRAGGGETSVTALAARVRDLGQAGRDPVYGHGLVGADLRVAPTTVAARGRLAR